MVFLSLWLEGRQSAVPREVDQTPFHASVANSCLFNMTHQLSPRSCQPDGQTEHWDPELVDILAMLLLGDGDPDSEEAAMGDCGVPGHHCDSEMTTETPLGTQSGDGAEIEHKKKAAFDIPSLLTQHPARARLNFSSAFPDDDTQLPRAPSPAYVACSGCPLTVRIVAMLTICASYRKSFRNTIRQSSDCVRRRDRRDE